MCVCGRVVEQKIETPTGFRSQLFGFTNKGAKVALAILLEVHVIQVMLWPTISLCSSGVNIVVLSCKSH